MNLDFSHALITTLPFEIIRHKDTRPDSEPSRVSQSLQLISMDLDQSHQCAVKHLTK